MPFANEKIASKDQEGYDPAECMYTVPGTAREYCLQIKEGRKEGRKDGKEGGREEIKEKNPNSGGFMSCRNY